MPVHLERSATGSSPAAIGWLQCRADSQGCAAALFQTTHKGEPLGFCFSRADRRQTPRISGAELGCRIQLACLRSVIRSAAPTPAVLIASDAGAISAIRECGLDGGLPFAAAFRNAARTTYTWVSGEPSALRPDRGAANTSEASQAQCLLDTALSRADPLEPLDRAAKAMDALDSDRALRAWTASAGVAIAVDLATGPGVLDPLCGMGAANRGTLSLVDRLRALLAAPNEAHCQATELDWPSELLPFQVDGVRALVASRRLLLADEMGLGKTLQAIAALRVLVLRKAVKDGLIVAPASILEQWRREIRKWAPEVRAVIVRGPASDRNWLWSMEAEVFLASYDTLRAEFDRDPRSQVWRRTWGLVVADEAQRIKNRNHTSGALKQLRRERSWALTGTPLENRADDLAAIMEFVDHDDSGEPRRFWPGKELAVRHRQLQLRRKKSEVLQELPAKQTTKLSIRLHSEQQGSYSRAEREGIVYLDRLGGDIRVHHLIALLTRLKQICNADPKSGRSAKLDDIEARLGELAAQGHKALVFSQYVDERFGVAAIVRRLAKFNPLAITGITPQEERLEVIDRFKREDPHKVLVLSMRVGGVGLNLQEASYVFYMDRWWNPAAERQSADRSHRIGQSMKVHVFKYSCVGTIEERIDEILEGKQRLFDEAVDDVSMDLESCLDRQDLSGLFGLGGVLHEE